MILYISCLCGYNKLLASKYKVDGFEIRATNLSNEWRDEVKAYSLKLPFKVVDGVASEA